MKTLVACELPEAALAELRALAVQLVYRPTLAPAELRELVPDVGILVVGGTRVSPEAISRARALQLIVHAGPGPGEIAIEEASAQGIFVAHCPTPDAEALAELTFGLILALDRRIVDAAVAMRDGRWRRSELADARGLAGRTLGILGYGPVGRLVAGRARAFDMHVLAWMPRLAGGPGGDEPGPAAPAQEPDVTFVDWPRDLARQSDIVAVLACPIDPDLQNLAESEFLDHLQDGAALVLVGCAGLDEAALTRAIEQQHLRVAVDVFASEPAGDASRYRCRICELPGVIATPHLGPLTEQARQATAAEVVRIVRSFIVSGEVHNCLNIAERSPATWQLVLRVRDQVGVMAGILEAIRADGINAQEIASRVFTGAKAAWCTIALDERPSTDALQAIRALPDVLHLELRAVV
ncbi:MAG: NAD(P)-dependent oxidoreductase [Planctomycetota bacterium]